MSNEITDIKKMTLLMISTGVIILASFAWNSCNVSNNRLIPKVRTMLKHKICFIRFVSFVWINDM